MPRSARATVCKLLATVFALILALVCGPSAAAPVVPASAPAASAARVPPLPWLSPDGQPTRLANEALALLADAASDGLDPNDYDVAALATRAAAMARDGADAAGQQAFSTALQRSLLRYLQHLHSGRVDPRRLGFRLPPRSPQADGAAALLLTLDQRPLPETVQALRPPYAQYQALRKVLAHYRQLAADATLVPPALPAKTVRLDDPLPSAPALARLLVALGDLPADTPTAPDRFDAALSEGVRRFQARHALEPDGLIGKTTRAALTTPLSQRVRQIELAMERMRWLSPSPGRRFIAINIPTFRLWAWDPAAPADTPPLTMSVIVGKALNTRTPVLQEDMRYLIFRPYWNVPRSIVRDELLPKIRRDAGVLARDQMEIVRGESDNAAIVPPTPDNLALLEQGALRLRQRPGDHNSLGLVKFMFPNDHNVYLHGTPAQRLFQRTRRDFSHGCVRVEDPVALAQWVLREQPEWTRERIEAAMNGQQSQRVDLLQPISVLLFYTTAYLAPENGQLQFASDIYGHDKRLEQALQAYREGRKGEPERKGVQ